MTSVSHPASKSIPDILLCFDGTFIPSLPPPGQMLGHQDLMGRPKPALRPPVSTSSSQSLPSGPSPIIPPPRMGSWKPGDIMPSMSLDSKTRAAVGHHGRNLSAGNADLLSVPRSSDFRTGSGSGTGVRRIASFEHCKPITSRHGRTASDPTLVEDFRNRAALTEVQRPERSASLIGTTEGLKLGESDDKDVVKILKTLQALTPPERMPHPLPPPPSTGVLAPLSLLTPMAIILEVLVWERELLKGNKPETLLPILRDGTKFYSPRDEDETDLPGEVNWNSTKVYILAFSSLLTNILPHLQSPPKAADKQKVEDLVKTARKYVSKMKKVFGEVAEMYMDKYSFVRGWWDESGMKGAAGEVGKWGDMFDV
ncbi:uncharacterized protein L203_105212 [Cryptococcus depauperatus CBS 7841]|uniref:Uncharacterized protein n=1 Tax=Cryptococcus depauperatus CBS 7841 TaxID=1295531 RepID=A0A1E3HYB8_9TREE|nr:hypothetical protein L203_05576 [Cryptococcus depauperatus CBS 7841]